ncbi:hypothetical protein JHJ32_13380 [Parapedobacter sp. ISTM3]|nr:hypothetical protein [Parapedobacter sp. ISTM3]
MVRLGNLGAFRLESNSTDCDMEEDMTAANIFRKRLLFYPGKHVKAVIDRHFLLVLT